MTSTPYSEIDSVLSAWAQKRGLRLHTEYKGYDVRSFDVPGDSGKLYQLWLDAPDAEKQIAVHAWDYKETRVDVQSALSDLGARLEEVYSTVMEWDKDFAKILSRYER